MNSNDFCLNPAFNAENRRLSDKTRALAWLYLSGGVKDRLKPCGFSLRDLDLPEDTPAEILHGKNAILTAEKSRIAIHPDELIAGNAGNIEATYHQVPGCNVPSQWGSISHTTADFGNAVRLGLKGLEKEILEFRSKSKEQNIPFYDGLLDVIAAMRIWTRRLSDACKNSLGGADAGQRRRLLGIASMLENVPENPPSSFAEAVQSLWIFFEFQRLCGNWSGLGRIDQYLGPYLEDDLKTGRTTLGEAREILAHFWIKGSEWCFGLRGCTGAAPGSGDAQNYQNIIISGIDEDGRQIENEVTYLVLDIVEELHISDYPVSVRLNSNSSAKLLRRVAQVQLLGGGIVAVYNEDVVLEALGKLGFGEREARSFTNDGCWEVIIPGKTNFSYFPKDALLPFQEALFADADYDTFEDLYAAVIEAFKRFSQTYAEGVRSQILPEGTRAWSNGHGGDAVLSLCMPSCRESGVSYSSHGTKYVIRGLHVAGLQDVANSLLAIKKFVYGDKLVSLVALKKILLENWEGEEALRMRMATGIKYYGNDDERADAMVKRLFDDCLGILGAIGKIGHIITSPGISTFGREIAFAPQRKATAFGKKEGEYLAPNFSPTPGTDLSPVPSIINSYCKHDLTKTPNGAPLDLRIDASVAKRPDAPDILAALTKTFLQKRGFYFQIETVSAEMLKKAKENPDLFPNLTVRISGWSARFASLDENWQNLIIARTEATV